LTQILNKRTAGNMFVRADGELPYGDVFVLLDIARRSGTQDIALLEKKGAKSSAAVATADSSNGRH
jgi:biopolymer transport protein ExbD